MIRPADINLLTHHLYKTDAAAPNSGVIARLKNYYDENVKEAIAEIEQASAMVTVLGSYPKAVL